MRKQCRTQQMGLGLACVGVLTLAGCVTTSDLEKLDATLQSRLDATDQTIHTQVGELRAEVKGEVARGMEALQAETRALGARLEKRLAEATAETKQTVADYAAESERRLEQVSELAADLGTQLKGVQQAVKQTLLGTYQAEEAALRERLRVLSQLRKQLGSSSSPEFASKAKSAKD